MMRSLFSIRWGLGVAVLLVNLLLCRGFYHVPLKPIKSMRLRSVHEDIKIVEPLTPELKLFVNNVQGWLRKQSFSNLLPKEKLLQIVFEIRNDPEVESKFYDQYDSLFEAVKKAALEETRPLSMILGPDTTKDIIKVVDKLDIYETSNVNAFLVNPVFESMLGGILYEGIFLFLQRVDILGNIINRFPIIGPIRVAIMKEFKGYVDKTLGGQIKTFLSSFNGIAVKRMAEFISSPGNKQALGQANQALVTHVLSQSPADLLSLEVQAVDDLKLALWKWLTETPIDELVSVMDVVYDKLNDKDMSRFEKFDIQDSIVSTPTGRKLLNDNVALFLRSPEGQEAVKAASELAEKYK